MRLTDRNERFFVSEIIREKILLYYDKEVPYSVEVEVEQFKDEDKILNLMCVIHVARESQKGIIIGHQGMGAETRGNRSPAGHGRILSEEGFPPVIREGEQRLAG